MKLYLFSLSTQKLPMYEPLVVKKTDQQDFASGSGSQEFDRTFALRSFGQPLGGLSLCFWIIHIYPRFVHCYHLLQETRVQLMMSLVQLAHCKSFCPLSVVQLLGDEFCSFPNKAQVVLEDLLNTAICDPSLCTDGSHPKPSVTLHQPFDQVHISPTTPSLSSCSSREICDPLSTTGKRVKPSPHRFLAQSSWSVHCSQEVQRHLKTNAQLLTELNIYPLNQRKRNLYHSLHCP